jgi:thiamine kinase-like enzyme
VLRLPGAGTERLVDRSHETHNHRIAAALGIAPAVLHGEADGLLVTRHITDARPLDAAAAAAPRNLAEVGAMLGKLHRRGGRFLGERHVFVDLDRYIAAAGPSGDGAIERLRREAEPARRVLEERAEALVPSHIDPSPANFIRGEGRLWLIDWEYAAMAEPGWDLAGFVAEADLDVPSTVALLAAYGRPADAAGLARIALWRLALDLLAVAWARLRLQADGDRSLAAMMADRSSRASAYVASTGYRHALDALGR